jgi:Pregnancy-associated plasma protein-A/Secretion system C-terminal sorting domain
MFKKLLLGLSAVGIVSTAIAQRTCSTDEHYRKLLERNPQLAAYEEQFEAQLQKKIAERTTAGAPDTTIYDIPIVVHVIHDYGTENLSDDDLYTAAAYWAVVYMEQNSDTADVIAPFKPYIGNPRMRLHLATKDPNGKPTKGIVRFQSYLTMSGDDEAKYNQWPPNEYVNIWLINQFGASDAGAAAYAYLPSYIPDPGYDGIICLYDYTDPSTKTIPHEMGHVMNLLHPWGNTNNPGVACGDDHVDDTPPTKGHMPTGCTVGSLYDTACATGYVRTYTSVLTGLMDSVVNYPDTTNAQNIMDYTYCQEMFTKGQVVRMRAALTSSTAGRNNLYSPANLAATGALAPMPDLPPVADFIMNKAVGGGVVTDNRSYFLAFTSAGSFAFRNASWNDTVSSVAWSFSNGASSPTSSSTGVVDNKFSVPGWVTVSLVANSNAGSDTLVNTHAVYAADTTPAGGIGYAQTFATDSAISNWPMFNYYNNQFKWEYYSGAGYKDPGCVRYRSFDSSDRLTGTAVGDHDDFFTPAFDLSNAGSGNLFFNFFSAGASTRSLPGWMTAIDDSVEIDVSTSGGLRWNWIGGFTGAQLYNNGAYGYEFAPTTPSQWVARAVNIPAAYRTANTYFRFRYWPGNTGGDVYIDDFNIFPFPAGVNEVVEKGGVFSVYPNPSSNGFNVVFKTGNEGSAQCVVTDITGKTVYTVAGSYGANALQHIEISRAQVPAAGMYFVTVTIDGSPMTQKLVVY